jgi:hypothetical protein
MFIQVNQTFDNKNVGTSVMTAAGASITDGNSGATINYVTNATGVITIKSM